MSRKAKDILDEPIVETTEVKANEEIQKETLLADDSSTSSEVSEKQETETNIEVRTEEKLKIDKNIDFEGRGFSSFEEAVKFPETNYFKGLGKEDKEEYLNWLKS